VSLDAKAMTPEQQAEAVAALSGMAVPAAAQQLDYFRTGQTPTSSTARVRSVNGARLPPPGYDKAAKALAILQAQQNPGAGDVLKATGITPDAASASSFTEDLTRVSSDRLLGYDPAAAQDFLQWAAANGFSPEASDAEFNRAYAAYIRQRGAQTGGNRLSADEMRAILNDSGQ
jgi:hypothetical protein